MNERKVSDYIPERVAYSQLAEECTELAHAALKLSRIADPEQCGTVGGISEDIALQNLIEETGDVLCCLEVALSFERLTSVIMVEDQIMEARDRKYNRWLERLENAEK
jgi:NTP pyrophosphatase (non-canonical NTP hydrolase)